MGILFDYEKKIAIRYSFVISVTIQGIKESLWNKIICYRSNDIATKSNNDYILIKCYKF